MTSAVVAAILLGAVASTWQAIRATRAERQAIHDRDDKEQARREAVTSANQAEVAAGQERQAKDAAIKAELQTTLRLADNYASRGLEDTAPLNARAALWFANAAVTSRDDPDQRSGKLDPREKLAAGPMDAGSGCRRALRQQRPFDL